MSAGIPLSEFTALLARQLAESAAVAERRQRDEYVALAAEVDGPLEAFLERTLGRTEEERKAVTNRYLDEVVGPLPKSMRFGEEIRGRLTNLFGELIGGAIAPEQGGWTVGRERLEKCAREKLRSDAERRYHEIRAQLRAGVPRTQIRGGTLSAKVLLQEDGNGAVAVRLAGEEAAKTCGGAISTLTIDFGVAAFPSWE